MVVGRRHRRSGDRRNRSRRPAGIQGHIREQCQLADSDAVGPNAHADIHTGAHPDASSDTDTAADASTGTNTATPDSAAADRSRGSPTVLEQ